MLEWMHDEDVVKHFRGKFKEKTLEDCVSFIHTAEEDRKSVHLAIADDNDEYMGTVSLKNIHEGSAEFAIVVRKCAMGQGFSKFAMQEIIRLGQSQYAASFIYWSVSPENGRAVRFYEKNGYIRCTPPEYIKGYTQDEIKQLWWFHA